MESSDKLELESIRTVSTEQSESLQTRDLKAIDTPNIPANQKSPCISIEHRQVGNLKHKNRLMRSLSSPQIKIQFSRSSSPVQSDPGILDRHRNMESPSHLMMLMPTSADSPRYQEQAIHQLKERLNQMYMRYKQEQEAKTQAEASRDNLSQLITEMEEKIISKVELMEKSVLRYQSKINQQEKHIQRQKFKMLGMFIFYRQDRWLLQNSFSRWRWYSKSAKIRDRASIMSKAMNCLRIMSNKNIVKEFQEDKEQHFLSIEKLVDKYQRSSAFLTAKIFLLQLFKDSVERRESRPTMLVDLNQAFSTINENSIQQVLINERESHKRRTVTQDWVPSKMRSIEDGHSAAEVKSLTMPEADIPNLHVTFEQQLFHILQDLDSKFTNLLDNRKMHMTQQQTIRKMMRTLQPESTVDLDIKEDIEDEKGVIERLKKEVLKRQASIEALKHITEEQKQVIEQVKQVSKERYEQSQSQHEAHSNLIAQLTKQEEILLQQQKSNKTKIEELTKQNEKLHNELSKLNTSLEKERGQMKNNIQQKEGSLQKWQAICLRREEEISQQAKQIEHLITEKEELRNQLTATIAQSEEYKIRLDMSKEGEIQQLTSTNREMILFLERKDKLLLQSQKNLEQQKQETMKWKNLVERYEKTLFSTNLEHQGRTMIRQGARVSPTGKNDRISPEPRQTNQID